MVKHPLRIGLFKVPQKIHQIFTSEQLHLFRNWELEQFSAVPTSSTFHPDVIIAYDPALTEQERSFLRSCSSFVIAILPNGEPCEYASLTLSEQQDLLHDVVLAVQTIEKLREHTAISHATEKLNIDFRTDRLLSLQLQQEALTRLLQSTDIFAENLHRALCDITEVVANTLNAAYVSIWVFDSTHSTLRCLDFFALQESTHTSALTLSVQDFPAYFQALENAFVINAPNVYEHPATKELKEKYLEPHGIVALLDAPIRIHGTLHGVLCIEHTEERKWTVEEQFFAFSTASILSMIFQIHQDKETQRQSKLLQQRLTATLNSIGEPLIVTDSNGKILLLNPAAESFLNQRLGTLIGEDAPTVMRFINANTSKPLPSPIEQVLKKHTPASIPPNTLLQIRDNRAIPVGGICTPIANAQGDFLGVTILLHDITQHRKWKETFTYATQRHWALLNALPDLVTIAEPSGKILEIYASSPEQHPLIQYLKNSSNIFSLFSEEQQKLIQEHQYSEQPLILEFTLPDHTDTQKWFEARITAFTEKEKIFLFRDITSQKTVMESLRRSQRELQFLLENMPIGCLIIAGTDILYANKEFIRASGYSYEELRNIGKQPSLLRSHHHSIFSLLSDNEDILHHSPNSATERTLFRKTGEQISVLTTAIPIHWKGRAATLLLLLDITQQKRQMEILGYTLQLNELINKLSQSVLQAEEIENIWEVLLQKMLQAFSGSFAMAFERTDKSRWHLIAATHQPPAALSERIFSLLDATAQHPKSISFFTPQNEDQPFSPSLGIPIWGEQQKVIVLAFSEPMPPQLQDVLRTHGTLLIASVSLLLKHYNQYHALRERHMQLTEVLQTSPLGIAILRNNEFLFVNTTLLQLLEISREDPYTEVKLQAAVTHLLTDSTELSIRPYITESGKFLHLQIYHRVIPQINSRILIIRDITSEVRQQNYLELQAKISESLLNNEQPHHIFQKLVNHLADYFPCEICIDVRCDEIQQKFTTKTLPKQLQTAPVRPGIHETALSNPQLMSFAARYPCYWFHEFSFANEQKIAVTFWSPTWELLNREVPQLQTVLKHILTLLFQKIGTEQQLQTALQESLQAIFSALHTYVFTVTRDSHGDFLYTRAIGKTPHQFFHRPVSEVIGKKVKEFFSEKEFALISARLEEAFRGKEVFLEEEWEGKYYLTKYVPIYSPAGTIREVLGASIDITERKRQEQKLLASQNRISAILEHLPAGIAIFEYNKKTRKVEEMFLNATVQKLLGRYPQNMVELFLALRHLCDQQTWEKIESILADIRKRSTPSLVHLPVPISIRGESGDADMWLQINYLKLPNPYSPDHQSEIFLFTDITELKSVENQLKSALLNEQQLRDLRKMLLQTISHEFRTAITGIQLSAELLRNYWNKISEAKRLEELQKISEKVKNLVQLLNNLLARTKIADSQQFFSPESVEIAPLIQDVVSDFEEECKVQKVRIQLQLQHTTPYLIIDPLLFQIILRNLISNAIKYSRKGTTVTIATATEPGAFILEVRDEGIGIPKEEISHIFESFYRASNAASTGGSGIGLSVVKEFVEIHNGTIVCTSELGKGTTFTIRLPALSEQQE